ncbi:MAG: DUF5110 domain-containing protein [Ruminococcaceae bacterium]|nr:DUF5110 domain-containing protein [Oscillospiraceae bacterium]
MLKDSLIAKTDAKADESQIFIGYGVRITLLSSKLIRVEQADLTTDLASFTVFNRRFDAGKMNVTKVNGEVIVETEDRIFLIKQFKPYSVVFKDTGKTEIFSKQKNLKGTRRTLDGTFGAVKLNDGLITDGGAYLLDDSKSVLLDETGHFIKRQKNSTDYYAFAYGKDYRETIREFYRISSFVPLIPRFALGVWWSRYHAYTQNEYLSLMDKFAEEKVPITVATVDMDWHWVKNLKEQFGVDYSGWTGYSWNSELFPDYRQFLRELKERNLHITLNLHPADGVHCYEDMYEEMAKAVGIDPASKQTVEFKCGNDDHWNAYFDVLHKPYEREGVDFWWIDWQQGTESDVDGLDPLNALNHYHFLDNAEDGRMPLILSRYAGLGSHRYPLGFSGDTAINHKVFDFQPYFTVTAANAAYSWWSHDIGGHHFGYRDDELYLRWIQFGVFSPIMRLHSTAIEVLGKEPWKYRSDIHEYSERWLRFRHALIPYLFTMDYRTHESGEAICEPLYYSYPENESAYKYKNEYMFGTELLVCPITKKQIKSINMGSVEAWLPKGRWVDIFTCQAYEGDRNITLFRDMDTIPVLAKEGAIIPLSADKGNRTDNPENLEIWAFSGNGEFTLYEDDSKVDYKDHNAKTRFEMKYENGSVSFTVNAAEGDLSVLPEKRNYVVKFKDLVNSDGSEAVLEFNDLSVSSPKTLTLENVKRKEKNEPRDEVIWAFSRWQGGTMKKNAVFMPFNKLTKPEEIREKLKSSSMPEELKLLIEERI